MQPIRNNILVKPCESDSISAGGIIVPDAYKAISNKVKIIKVGSGTKEKPMRLKEGQVGHRVKDWGTEIIMEGEKYFLMTDDSIIAINE